MPRQSSVQSILCCIVRCNLDDFRYFGISLLSSIKMGSCTKGSTLQVIAGIRRYIFCILLVTSDFAWPNHAKL